MNPSAGQGGGQVGFYNIVAAMLRRWYVPMLAVTLACGLWVALGRDGGGYTTSTVVAFTLPSRVTLLPESGAEDSNVIAFAGLVANEINAGRPAPVYASRDAPLYGVGVRQGVLVGLPNSGGQWTSSYSRAEIEIQIVGRTYEEVRDRQAELLDLVFRISNDQQANSPLGGRIRATIVPLTPEIEEISPTASSRLVALAALLMSAMLLSGGISAWLERRWSRERDKEMDNSVTKLSVT